MDKNQPQVSGINQARSMKSQNKGVMMKKMEYGNNSICNYTHRICLQNKLEGCDHCIRHILYDKNGIFKQCSYVHPQSHKRCPNAARKTERKESVCPWHLKKYFIKRKQQNLNEEKSSTKTSTTQQLFRDLEHYCPNTEHDKNRLNSNWIKLDDDSITASDHLRRKIVESSKLQHAENTDDEDLNDPQVENTFRTDIIDSDSESIDSDHEEPLKHAGIYTPEEVSSILRDKMIRLQSLYTSELGYLQYLMKEKYKRYINNVRSQQDVFQFSPFKLANGILSDDYNKCKALMRYHRSHGSEALLKAQVKEKRRQLNDQAQSSFDPTNKPKTPQLCIYEKEGEKCERKAMPLTHYCKIHVLYDNDQVLFRPCAYGNPPCLNPVMSFQKGNSCILHEDQKEPKELNKDLDMEDDENMNFKNDVATTEFVAETNLENNLTNTLTTTLVNNLEIDSVETTTTSLFGLDQFNQLDN